MKKVKLVALILVAVLTLSSCTNLTALMGRGASGTAASSSASDGTEEMVSVPKKEYEALKKLETTAQLMQLVEENFYRDASEETMLDGASRGMLQALEDPYTFYYSPEEFSALWEDDKGEYEGIGIQISTNYETGVCSIVRVFDPSPAMDAGVRKGDILYQVEDIIVNALTLQQAVDTMRGAPGTFVKVVFKRDGKELPMTIERKKITTNRLERKMLTDTVGLISLYQFAENSGEQFKAATEELVSLGAKGIIIDLRDNPGGWVDDAVAIGDLFLDKGILSYLQYKNGERENYYTKNGKYNVQLVIMVNGQSASSSEILAGGLQERAGATVVGTQSFGKGVVQAVLPVGREGAGAQITVAQYFTPNGKEVHGIGITPDVVLEESATEGEEQPLYQFGSLDDPWLKRALEIMEDKLSKNQP